MKKLHLLKELPKMYPKPRQKINDYFGGFVTSIDWIGGYAFATFESLFPLCTTEEGEQVKQGTIMQVKISGPIGLEESLKVGDHFSAKVQSTFKTPDMEEMIPIFRVFHKSHTD